MKRITILLMSGEIATYNIIDSVSYCFDPSRKPQNTMFSGVDSCFIFAAKWVLSCVPSV